MSKHYLLTGSTGVVGSAVLRRLAQRQARVTLLIRADNDQMTKDRLAGLLHHCGTPAGAAETIDAVAGDLYARDLGLPKQVYDRIAGQCTHILHCAGNVHMNLPLEQARRQTLAMTEGMLTLMRSAARVEKMEYVSTVGVAGHTPGEMPEAWISQPRTFRNTYEAAKAEAEKIVRKEIETGLPITVHRPSMVVGDARTGKNISFQVFYYLCEFLCGARTRGFIPWLGDKTLDIIPSDYVAAVIDWSSGKTDLPTPILHLCSGTLGAVPLSELVSRVRHIFTTRGRRLPKLRQIPAQVLHAMLRLLRPLVPPKHRRAVDALPFFFAYLKENQTFGNDTTRQLLTADGIDLPLWPDYLETVLDYYLGKVEK